MRYSEARFRRVLAWVRILVGFVYICYGYEKLFDAAFFENSFIQRLVYSETAVAPWYSWMWQILWEHTHRWAAFFGTVEMFIGVALLLGLATRPACLVGMVYMLHLLALTWFPNDQAFLFWRFLEIHLPQILLFCLFWLMGVGHAGDIWGLGALYHRLRLRRARPSPARYEYFGSQEDSEPVAAEIPNDKAS